MDVISHKLVIAELINKALHPVLGFEIPQHIILALLSCIVLIVLLKIGTKSLKMFPEKGQVAVEGLYKAFISLIDDVIGPEGRKFLPALATLGLFIAVSNLMGQLPELGSATANLNVTLGCALFVFFYYHWQGIKKHGVVKYAKTFAGPVWWLAWLFIPIEIISHFSRPLSLSMRLFGNIFGEDLVIIIIASIVPYIAPVPVMALAVFTSLLQAFIFVMLSSIYLSGAISDEH